MKYFLSDIYKNEVYFNDASISYIIYFPSKKFQCSPDLGKLSFVVGVLNPNHFFKLV